MAVGNCQIVTIDSNATLQNDKNIYWKSDKYNAGEYKPIANYNHHSELNAYKKKVDVILLSANSISELNDISQGLKPILEEDTLILVDSCFANNIDCLLNETFPNNVTLSIISEVIVKIIKYDTRNVFNHLGNRVTTRIGTTLSNAPKHIVESLTGTNAAGRKLIELTQILQSNGVYPCPILQPSVRPTINSFIWKQILIFVSFGILSVVYGELSLKSPSRGIIIKKVFHDLLNIASISCENEFPKTEEADKCEKLFLELLDQYNQLHTHYKIESSKGERPYASDELLDAPLCIYNFSNNFNTHIPLCLEQLLKTSKKLNTETPFIECINSFYLEIEKINEQKVFDWIKKASYRPERPLSLPKPKVVHTSLGYNNNSFSSLPLSGTETPPTPSSNTVPTGYSFYPEYNVMVPTGTNPTFFQNQQMVAPQPQRTNGGFGFGFGAKKELIQHPRFKNIPKDEVNGKKISYHQIKNLAYPTTRGSTAPQSLSQAHKHIYKYTNLNHIFESVNNRYGAADSLDIFKLSSGFKDEDEEDEEDDEAYDNESDNILNSKKGEMEGDNKQSEQNEYKEYSKKEAKPQQELSKSHDGDGSSGSDVEMADADEELP